MITTIKNVKLSPEKALPILKAIVERHGYKVSAGSWFDNEMGKAFAFSVESCGPATYGHSKFSAEFTNSGPGFISWG